MNTKGFIFALGPWSGACKPFSIEEEFAAIPPILYSLHFLASEDIRKILICATPHDAAEIHSMLADQLWDAEISYLLAEEDSNVTDAIELAAEFFEQSAMILMGAGVYCSGRGISDHLKSNFKGRRGATAFRLRSGMTGEDWMIPEMLLLDVRTRKILAGAQAGSIEELRKRCLTSVKYFEVRLPEDCFYLNAVDGVSVRKSALRDRDFIKKIKALSELTGRPANS